MAGTLRFRREIVTRSPPGLPIVATIAQSRVRPRHTVRNRHLAVCREQLDRRATIKALACHAERHIVRTLRNDEAGTRDLAAFRRHMASENRWREIISGARQIDEALPAEFTRRDVTAPRAFGAGLLAMWKRHGCTRVTVQNGVVPAALATVNVVADVAEVMRAGAVMPRDMPPLSPTHR